MQFDYLNVEIDGGIAVAEMPYPNFDRTERLEWSRLIDEASTSDDIRVVVITGWGNPPIDRPKVFDKFDPLSYYRRAAREPVAKLLELDKPVVVALDGAPDVMTIPLCSDIVIAERTVTFDDHHVPLGVVSATQPFLWPLSAGLMKAKRYILTGERISAEEAERIGLITEVVDEGQARPRAMEYASRLASLRPEAVQATKHVLNQWLRAATSSVLEHGLALEFMLFPEHFARGDQVDYPDGDGSQG